MGTRPADEFSRCRSAEPGDDGEAHPVETSVAGDAAAALTHAPSTEAEADDALAVVEAAEPVPAIIGANVRVDPRLDTIPCSSTIWFRRPSRPGPARRRVGAENPGTASDQRDHRQPNLALTVSSPRSMISRCGYPTRLPDARPRAELACADAANEVPRASRTGDPLGSFSEKVRARASESTEVLPGVQR